MLNINDVAEQAHTLTERRGYKTDVFSCLKHCAGEVTEAVEANTIYNKTGEKADQNHLAEELADIIICALTASAEEEIDIERAVNVAMLKNARRAYGTEN
jgi:NTP pyrophosphatase (non-canonical NTP hydrolase)